MRNRLHQSCNGSGHPVQGRQTPLRNILPALETALDYSLTSGDKVMSIMTIGVLALYRFFAGQDVSEVEAFSNYAPEEFELWEEDIRGGMLLISARQVCRALQGKTGVDQLATLLDDERHQREKWLADRIERLPNPERTRDLYEAITLQAYFHFGHYQYVVDVGRRLVASSLHDAW